MSWQWDDTASVQNRRSPVALALSFTHILGNMLDKRIDKAEALSFSTMSDGLLGSFAKFVCKMWVRIRALAVRCFIDQADLHNAILETLSPGIAFWATSSLFLIPHSNPALASVARR